MVGVLVAILLAAVVFWVCVALGLPAAVGVIAAALVLAAGLSSGGHRYRGRRL